jgi:hypothetical protein
MRAYPQDSAHAAARVVAMIALADGHLSQREAERLESAAPMHEIGLPPGDWARVLRDYCEDLQVAASSGLSPLALDPRVVDAVLADIREPRLQRLVMSACTAVVDSDAHRAHGESSLMRQVATRWSPGA